VTAIAKNAFKNCKKLKKITLSKNTVLIQKNAFYGCKSLKKVIVKSKVVKSVGKKAFAKTHKKLVIKVPKSKFKVYSTKTFKKKGQVATAKIKK